MAVKPIVHLTKPEVIQVLENITSVGEHHLHGSFHSSRKIGILEVKLAWCMFSPCRGWFRPTRWHSCTRL